MDYLNASLSTDLIKKRKSIRTYLDKKIEVEKKVLIREELSKLSNNQHRFEMIEYKFGDGAKIGTYGVITGATHYIVGILSKALLGSREATIEFGYAYESIILKLTALGLGSCWMSSTFKNKDVAGLIDLKNQDTIVMVSPFGYASDKVRMIEKISHTMTKSYKRKAWKELFFDHDFNTELSYEQAGAYKVVLEMLRLAPSAVNSQPWRILKTNDSYDFYIEEKSGSGKNEMKMNLGYNDIGIAKLHFELTAREKGLAGKWFIKKEFDSSKYTYIGSWDIKK